MIIRAGYDCGYYQSDLLMEVYNFSDYQQQSYSHPGLFYEDQSFSMFSPLQFPPWLDQLGEIQDVESKKKIEGPFPSASLELLNNRATGVKRLNIERAIKPSYGTPCTSVACKELSAEDIMRIAGERFAIQSCNTGVDVVSMLENPFCLSFSGNSAEQAKNVALAEHLLASAGKVGNQQLDRASRLLDFCHQSSSDSGNPVQRIVYYFSQALRMKIDRETRKITPKDCGKCKLLSIDSLVINSSSIIQACHEAIPFYQAAHLTAIQAIIENVADAKRIHVIDLKIRNGLQWTILMQALATRRDRPLELLKITAVETTPKNLMEDTGKRLMSFAQAMNIPFSFKLVPVSDLTDLKEELFEIDAKEVVAVYSEYALMNLIVLQEQLGTVMRVISNIKPCIMVVIESQANHNSPVFINRFVESLFYFSAYFDCVDACMQRDNPERKIVESLFLGEGIRNIVASEGEDRDIRNVKIDVWRNFFIQFEMAETELSESSMFQAKLAIRKFSCGSSCMLDKDGKSLVIGWKRTRLLSVSTWKFIG